MTIKEQGDKHTEAIKVSGEKQIADLELLQFSEKRSSSIKKFILKRQLNPKIANDPMQQKRTWGDKQYLRFCRNLCALNLLPLHIGFGLQNSVILLFFKSAKIVTNMDKSIHSRKKSSNCLNS